MWRCDRRCPSSASLAERRQFTDVRRERQGDTLVRREEFVEIETLEFERFRENDFVLLDAIRAVEQVAPVQLEQTVLQRDALPAARSEEHDLDAQDDERRRIG